MTQAAKPDYRGIDADSIIDSLKRAESFVRGLHLGPKHDEILDEWLAKDPYTKIAAAQDRRELARIMGETGSAYMFSGMSEILMLHAVSDAAGKKLLEDLGSWGAFDGARLAVYTPLDEEQDRYIVREYAKVARAEGNKAQPRLDKYVDFLRDEQPGQVDDTQEGLDDLLVMMAENDADFYEELELTFEHGDLRDRHIVKTLLFVMSGLAEEWEKIEVPSAIKRYGIVIENMPKDFAGMQKVIGTLADDVAQTLMPFYETDEVNGMGMGTITQDRQQSGVMFMASEAAARAVAAAFPDRKVIDYTGRVIGGPEIEPAPESKGPSVSGP